MSASQNAALQAPLAPIIPKQKTTAVLLAVFLTFWTWIYTYKVDAWKFWLNFALSILSLGLWAVFVAWPWAIIDAARRSDDWYLAFPNGDIINHRQQNERALAYQQALAAQQAPAAELAQTLPPAPTAPPLSEPPSDPPA